MNTVTIKLLTDDGIGIPNLIAVLYDLDKATPNTPNTEANEDWGFWSQFHGDRLGSAITDRDGNAEFKFEDSEFQVTQSEKRPDLVVFILAPERYFQDVQGLPTATPPAQQIVHRSEIARANAGRQEAYVIEISSERLAKFNLQTPQSRLAVDQEKIADFAVLGLETTKAINEKLKPHVQAEFKKIKASRDKATSLFTKFVPSTVPESARREALIIGPDDSLDAAQAVAIERSLARMETYTAPLTIRLTPSISDELGIDLEHLRPVDIDNLISRSWRNYSLTRTRSLPDICGPCISAAPPDEEPGGPPADDEDADAPPPVEPDLTPDLETARREVTRRVLGQIADLATWDPRKTDKIATIETVNEALQGLSLPKGPADIPAFHDFHSLQIAFDHVWFEAYDERIRELGTEVFVGVEQFKTEWGIETGELDPFEGMEDLETSLDEAEREITDAIETVPFPDELSSLFGVSQPFFNWLSYARQTALRRAVYYINNPTTARPFPAEIVIHTFIRDVAAYIEVVRENIRQWQTEWRTWLTENSTRTVPQTLAQQEGSWARVSRLITELKQRIKERYAFRVFAPGSVNYGLLLTYRQTWEPLNYQVGDLVATIPLAPGETRRYTKKRNVKRSRAEREVENSLSIRRSESTVTSRSQAEILRKATLKTNFQYSSRGATVSGEGGEADTGSTTTFDLDVARDSSETKQDFHESVLKAAEEYKQERTLEINSSTTEEIEETSSGEISNPNNEIPVTYLFYELQRQYNISEQIYKVTPVVLVAQDVPAPHDIDEDWLIANSWILRRVLLDDSFKTALDYLTQGLAGDEFAVEVIRDEWQIQRDLVQKTQAQVTTLVQTQDELRRRLNTAIQQSARTQGFLEDIGEFFGGGEDDGMKARARVEAAERALEFNQADVADARNRLAASQSAFNEASRKLTNALQTQLNRRIAVDQLRVHVKDNILYYMHAIWNHEVPDQRFFRLYDMVVNVPEPPEGEASVSPSPAGTIRGIGDLFSSLGPTAEGDRFDLSGMTPPSPPSVAPWTQKRLIEIAAVDRPLGYKGNYIILPLKDPNYITNFMAREFINDYFGVWDPDDDGNFPTDDLIHCVECMTRKVERHEADAADLDFLKRILLKRLRSPRRDKELVVIPSDQLFIEALPGAHPLLEDFKRLHRAVDVGKAVAEARGMELENLRKASRLVEGEREDPETDKKIIVEGSRGVVVDTD
jgi:hypothetical protein